MSTSGVQVGIARAVTQLVGPLRAALASEETLRPLLARYGWTADTLDPAGMDRIRGVFNMGDALAELADVGQQLAAADGAAGPDPATVAALAARAVAALGRVTDAVRGLSSAQVQDLPFPLSQPGFVAELAADLLDGSLIDWLERHRPTTAAALILLGLVTVEPKDPDDVNRLPYLSRRVRWDRLGLVPDPIALISERFGWGDPAGFDHVAVLAVLARAAWHMDVPAGLRTPPAELVDRHYLPGSPAREQLRELRIPLRENGSPGDDDYAEFGLSIIAVPAGNAAGTVPAGLLVSAYLEGMLPPEDDETVSIIANGALETDASFAVRFEPGSVQVLSAVASTAIDAALVLAATPDEPWLIAGTRDGARVELAQLRAAVELHGAIDDLELEVSLATGPAPAPAKIGLTVQFGDGDGLLAQLFGTQPHRVELGGELRWSSKSGLSLSGTSGLEVDVPVRAQVAGVRVDSVSVRVQAAAGGLRVALGLNGFATVGPFTVSVREVGLALDAAPAAAPAARTVGDLALGFGVQLPRGLGLAVDAYGISGGGFLDRDPAGARYSGAVDLKAGTVDVTGVGLLENGLPGHPGYALLIVMRATFPAIQIGLGFALTGVGGLIALNRRIDVDILRNRLAAGIAGRMLCPQDPIRSAPALLADLDAVFPVAPGVTVVGPTAQLIWAELVHLDVGVFIELPGPSRVVVLGSAHAEMQRDGKTYLTIRVDVLGDLDLRAGKAAFDAVLVDSHLMGILDLTGGAAFRVSWVGQPYSMLTLGGFNPAYNPEPLTFPASLTRIAMVHGTKNDEVYLRFEGYFAVTSNTLQFGAAVEALIQSGGFVVHGTLGFDALIRFVPFHFQVDIRASVDVSYHGHNLAGLTLTGSLTGPGPVVLQAKVCIELLFFDICFSHTFELGAAAAALPATAADLLDALLTELENPARLRAGGMSDPYVQLRAPEAGLGVPVVVPTGALVWEQQLAPLSLLLDRVGGTPLPQPAQVHAATAAASTTASDWFAPGQFLDLTDDQGLTRPGYELLSSGLRLAGPAQVDGPWAPRVLQIKEIRLPARDPRPELPSVPGLARRRLTAGRHPRDRRDRGELDPRRPHRHCGRAYRCASTPARGLHRSSPGGACHRPPPRAGLLSHGRHPAAADLPGLGAARGGRNDHGSRAGGPPPRPRSR